MLLVRWFHFMYFGCISDPAAVLEHFMIFGFVSNFYVLPEHDLVRLRGTSVHTCWIGSAVLVVWVYCISQKNCKLHETCFWNVWTLLFLSSLLTSLRILCIFLQPKTWFCYSPPGAGFSVSGCWFGCGEGGLAVGAGSTSHC
jgi:hypothetical protein